MPRSASLPAMDLDVRGINGVGALPRWRSAENGSFLPVSGRNMPATITTTVKRCSTEQRILDLLLLPLCDWAVDHDCTSLYGLV